MASSIVQSPAIANADSTPSVTLTGVTAGNSIIACVYSYQTTSFGVTDGGVAITRDSGYYDPASNYVSAWFSKHNVSSGSHTIAVTSGSTNTFLCVFEVAFDSAAVGLYDTVTTNYSASSASLNAGPITTATNNEVILSTLLSVDLWDYPTDGGGWTDTDVLFGSYSRICHEAGKVATTSGSFSATWTRTAANAMTTLAAYKPTGGAAATTKKLPVLGVG